jgi:hypothetical protein
VGAVRPRLRAGAVDRRWGCRARPGRRGGRPRPVRCSASAPTSPTCCPTWRTTPPPASAGCRTGWAPRWSAALASVLLLAATAVPGARAGTAPARRGWPCWSPRPPVTAGGLARAAAEARGTPSAPAIVVAVLGVGLLVRPGGALALRLASPPCGRDAGWDTGGMSRHPHARLAGLGLLACDWPATGLRGTSAGPRGVGRRTLARHRAAAGAQRPSFVLTTTVGEGSTFRAEDVGARRRSSTSATPAARRVPTAMPTSPPRCGPSTPTCAIRCGWCS